MHYSIVIFEWSISILIRSHQKDELEKVLSRTFIHALAKEQPDKIGLLFRNIMNAMDTLPELIQNNPRDPIDYTYSAKIALEIISRLTIALSAEQLGQLILLLGNIPFDKFFTASILEAIGNLFERLFLAMSATNLFSENIMKRLLAFPYGSIGIDKIPEAFLYISKHNDKLFLQDMHVDSEIETLFRDARNSQYRDAALRRLFVLAYNGALSPQKIDRYQKLLLEKTDKFGIPINMLLDKTAYLWNISSNDKIIQNIRNYFLKSNIEEKENGVRYYRELLVCSESNFFPEEDRRIQSIVWGIEEQEILLKKIAEDWNNEKCHFEDYNQSGRCDTDKFYLYNEQLKGKMNRMCDVLNHIIAPSYRQLSTSSQQIFKRIITEIMSTEIAGDPVLLEKIMLSKIFIASTEDISTIKDDLLQSIMGIDEDKISAAIGTMYHWKLYSDKKGISIGLPTELFDRYIDLIVLRRRPGLESALHHFNNFSKNLTDDIYPYIDVLVQAVDYLHNEIQLPNLFDVVFNRGSKLIPNVHDIYDYHHLAHKFAKDLCDLLATKGRDIPPSLQRMQDEGTGSILPEIRNLWA